MNFKIYKESLNTIKLFIITGLILLSAHVLVSKISIVSGFVAIVSSIMIPFVFLLKNLMFMTENKLGKHTNDWAKMYGVMRKWLADYYL